MQFLPKVKEDICSVIEKEFDDKDSYGKNAKRLLDENPIVASFLGNFIAQVPSCCGHTSMISALIVYRLLESQAEADWMDESFK